MCVSYSIDREQRLVRTRAWGVASVSNLHDWMSHLLADPLFDPDYRSLADIRSVTEVAIDSMTLAEAAATPLFDIDSRFAIVAESDYVFGMARMFATFSERVGKQVLVFRTMPTAEVWLGLRAAPAGEIIVDAGGWEMSEVA